MEFKAFLTIVTLLSAFAPVGFAQQDGCCDTMMGRSTYYRVYTLLNAKNSGSLTLE